MDAEREAKAKKKERKKISEVETFQWLHILKSRVPTPRNMPTECMCSHGTRCLLQSGHFPLQSLRSYFYLSFFFPFFLPSGSSLFRSDAGQASMGAERMHVHGGEQGCAFPHSAGRVSRKPPAHGREKGLPTVSFLLIVTGSMACSYICSRCI